MLFWQAGLGWKVTLPLPALPLKEPLGSRDPHLTPTDKGQLLLCWRKLWFRGKSSATGPAPHSPCVDPPARTLSGTASMLNLPGGLAHSALYHEWPWRDASGPAYPIAKLDSIGDPRQGKRCVMSVSCL